MESNIKMLTVKDVQRILHVGKDKAYALTRSEGFPTVRIGKNYLIPEKELEAWITEHIGMEVKES